jgi:hypothetical protein
LLTEVAGVGFSSKAAAFECRCQTHIMHADGWWVVGIQEPLVDEGMGSFANHDEKDTNAVVERMQSASGSALVLKASRAISKSEEIFVDYGPEASEEYRVAMGSGRFVVETKATGATVINFVEILRDGDTLKYQGKDSGDAVDKVARDHSFKAIHVAPGNNACFVRSVAIALDDLLKRNRSAIQGHFFVEATEFLRGVDVLSMKRGLEDFKGATRMRNILGEFVMTRILPAWDNVYDATGGQSDQTIGTAVTALALNEFPDTMRSIEKEIDKARRNNKGDLAWSASEYAAGHVCDKIKIAVTRRTCDAGALTIRLIAVMFGVDIHVYSVERCSLPAHARTHARARARPAPPPRPRKAARQAGPSAPY